MNDIAENIVEKKWYAVQVLVGYEKSVRENLLERIDQHDLGGYFGDVLLPVENTLEIRQGKKKMTERKLYPGYLFLEMCMIPECWHLVRKTRRVGGFISGTNEEPAALALDVVSKIHRQMQDSIEKGPVIRAQFATGDQVRIKEGPFSDFSGTVDSG